MRGRVKLRGKVNFTLTLDLNPSFTPYSNLIPNLPPNLKPSSPITLLSPNGLTLTLTSPPSYTETGTKLFNHANSPLRKNKDSNAYNHWIEDVKIYALPVKPVSFPSL